MAKKKEPQAERALTKRQLTHWQKQALRQRIIGFSGIITIVAVIALIVSGWYFKQYVPVDKPLRETVVEVNGHKFSMSYYVDAIDYFIGGQTSYISYALDPVLTDIEQIELIREQCAKLNAQNPALDLTVTDAEVSQQIAANSLSDNQAVRDIVRGQLLRDKLLSNYFGPKISTSGEQRDVAAMFLESQTQVDDIKAQIDAGADFGQLAAADSLESTSQGDSGALGSHAQGIFDYLLSTTGFDDAIFAQQVGTWGTFQDTTTSKQVGYWLVKVTERNSDNSQVHVSGILLSSLEEAQSVKSQLDAGADFTTLAQQYSKDWSDTNKDDLGWITTSSADAFKSYVFNTDTAIGAVSAPIKDTNQSTTGGVWLFKVTATTTGDISSTDQTDLKNQAFNTWLTALQADTVNNKITSYLDATKKAFATTRAGG